MENLTYIIGLFDLVLVSVSYWYICIKIPNMQKVFNAQLEQNVVEKRLQEKYGREIRHEGDGLSDVKDNHFQKALLLCFIVAMLQFLSLIVAASMGVNWVEHINLALVLVGGAIILIICTFVFQSKQKVQFILGLLAFFAVAILVKSGFDSLLVYDWRLLTVCLAVIVLWSAITIYREKIKP